MDNEHIYLNDPEFAEPLAPIRVPLGDFDLAWLERDERYAVYSLPDLLRKWARNELTVEQAIGHILQHLVALSSHRADQEKPPTTHARQSEQAPPNTK